MKYLPSANFVVFGFCILLLAACGPVYRTNYTLNEPATDAGRLCSKNVIEMSDTCVENCRAMARQCEDSGFRTSIGYGTGSYGHGVGYGVGYGTMFDDTRDCSSTRCEESCLAAARKAHTNCGGTVTEETVCTANCPVP